MIVDEWMPRLVIHLIRGVREAGHGVFPDGGVGEVGAEEFQSVFRIDGRPARHQLHSLAHFRDRRPRHTLQKLGQRLSKQNQTKPKNPD